MNKMSTWNDNLWKDNLTLYDHSYGAIQKDVAKKSAFCKPYSPLSLLTLIFQTLSPLPPLYKKWQSALLKCWKVFCKIAEESSWIYWEVLCKNTEGWCLKSAASCSVKLLRYVLRKWRCSAKLLIRGLQEYQKQPPEVFYKKSFS